MKQTFIFLILFFTFACKSNNQVYWCGDHPCINKKEKESYFKKSMIVEVREFNKNDLKENSEIDKIINKAKKDEKKRIKSDKIASKTLKKEEARRIKEQKKLTKQLEKEEARRIKEEIKLENQIKKNEAKRIKKNKKLLKDTKIENNDNLKKVQKNSDEKLLKNTISLNGEFSKFNDLLDSIYKKNSIKEFPDINKIPN